MWGAVAVETVSYTHLDVYKRQALERSLTKHEERIEVLEKMVLRLYEDMVADVYKRQELFVSWKCMVAIPST